MSDFFLWGGFVFTLLWHSFAWRMFIVGPNNGTAFEKEFQMYVAIINLGISGVALCCFGYLAFGTI